LDLLCPLAGVARWRLLRPNLRLALEADLSAPVSRASVARLRAAGWLASEPPGEG
jgi:hypothetical protein